MLKALAHTLIWRMQCPNCHCRINIVFKWRKYLYSFRIFFPRPFPFIRVRLCPSRFTLVVVVSKSRLWKTCVLHPQRFFHPWYAYNALSCTRKDSVKSVLLNKIELDKRRKWTKKMHVYYIEPKRKISSKIVQLKDLDV